MKLSPSPALLLSILVFGGVALFGCDDGFEGAKTGIIKLSPQGFTFPKIAVGDNVDQSVIIENTGSGDLRIAKIKLNISGNDQWRLYWGTDTHPGPYAGIDLKEKDHFNYPITIPPDARYTLTLNYAPQDDIAVGGNIVSLDTNVGDVDLPIQISDTGAEIRVSPRSINFGRVRKGDEEYREVTVSNAGEAVLNIQQITVSGSFDFSPLIEIEGQDRDPRQQLPEDPDQDGIPGLSPPHKNRSEVKHFIIKLKYAPPEEGPDAGKLIISSDDPNQPRVEVNIEANSETPCLTVTPRALEFRTSLVNRTDSRPLSIESCGGQQLDITGIEIQGGSDPAFSVVQESLPESFPSLLPALTPGELPPSRQIQIAFSPREQRIYNGTLIIKSNDPVTPERPVSLLGRGVQNACPQAEVVSDEFRVAPLDSVILDGSPSIDPDGDNNQPVRYEWVVTNRPGGGSTSEPVERFFNPLEPQNGGEQDNPASSQAMFFVDSAGTYTLELRVTDNLGAGPAACSSAVAVVTIVAKPDEAIHIQLLWNTPTDEDQLDRYGTDMDLHLLHPRAQNWFEPGMDCYFRSPNPEWGQQGNTSDNPNIDIDDINGAGPENISLSQPELTELEDGSNPYIVGVHYYKSSDRVTGTEYGPSYAQVRIFLNGELAWDFSGEGEPGRLEMEEEGHFWDVAAIHWTGIPEEAWVSTRNRYYTELPGLSEE